LIVPGDNSTTTHSTKEAIVQICGVKALVGIVFPGAVSWHEWSMDIIEVAGSAMKRYERVCC